MLTHPTLDDTARHFFSFIYKTKRRKGSRTVIIGGKRHREQHRIPGNRVRSESYLGPRGGLALKFSWATHDF
ncbi:hypothetical protein SRHO_G00345550 [Serrasalmus rhombeus]